MEERLVHFRLKSCSRRNLSAPAVLPGPFQTVRSPAPRPADSPRPPQPPVASYVRSESGLLSDSTAPKRLRPHPPTPSRDIWPNGPDFIPSGGVQQAAWWTYCVRGFVRRKRRFRAMQNAAMAPRAVKIAVDGSGVAT